MKTRNYILRILLLLLLLIMFSMLTFLMVFYTRNSSEAMRKDLYRKMQIAVQQTSNNVDYRFSQMMEGATALLSTIYPYLNETSSLAEETQEYTDICRTMNEYINKHMISFLRLYVPDDKIYANQISMKYLFHSLEDLPENSEYLNKGGTFWETTHDVKMGDGSIHSVLTCIITVKKLSDYDQLAGVLCADVEVEQLSEIFSEGTSDYEHMYLVNENGDIICQGDSENGEEIEPIPKEIMKDIQSKESGYLDDSHLVYTFDKLETAGWYVISTSALNRVYTMDDNVVKTIITMWIAVFLILIIVTVAVLYSVNLNKTVRKINEAIQVLVPDSEGEIPVKEASKRREIGEKIEKIGLTFLEKDAEEIVLSINNIVEERYKDRLAISEYRMESLQAQIKPHFLYNTLDAIKWMIMDENSEDAVWMVNALSKYLRMSINKGDQIVTLEEEIKLMQVYLEIMERRFRNKFKTLYDLEKETLQFPIPKLSLQPLVENALLHGIFHSEKTELFLTVRAWRQDDTYMIQIEDNGCGMKKEKAEYLSTLESSSGAGYGIANVHKRLDIFGHGQCRFLVESKEQFGTCITIELPVPE